MEKNQNETFIPFFVLMTCILFSSYSSLELSPEEKALRQQAKLIPIANAITVTELQHYQEIGPLDCGESMDFQTASEGEENCRESLKLEGARQGADLIIVESSNHKGSSLHMHARAFKKRM